MNRSKNTLYRLLGFCFSVSFFYGITAASERKITLTTYYPAPFGSYERVQAGKGVTPFAAGDIAIQRQLRIGKTLTIDNNRNFGQMIINIDPNTLPAGYIYGSSDPGGDKYIYYDVANDSFAQNYSSKTSDNLLPLDIAVAGHTRISGEGSAAIAGYLDVLAWDKAANKGGEITLRGVDNPVTPGNDPVNWAMTVYNDDWRLRSNVKQPHQNFGGLSGPFDMLRIEGDTGNVYAGKMFSNAAGQVPDKVVSGSLIAGTGALVRYKRNAQGELWNAGVPPNPGIYSIDDSAEGVMHFVTNITNPSGADAFRWYGSGMSTMTLNSSDGLTIEDNTDGGGLWVKGIHETADEQGPDNLGLRIDNDTWLNGNVGIGGKPDSNYGLLVYDSGLNTGWGTLDENDVFFKGDLVVQDRFAIGFSTTVMQDRWDNNTSLYVSSNVKVGIFDALPLASTGGITTNDFIMSVDGDFFSANGALIKSTDTAYEFAPKNPGIYSNEDASGLDMPMNFVVGNNDFKWYGEGYDNNGVIDPADPLMVLSPEGLFDFERGLTVKSGVHIKSHPENDIWSIESTQDKFKTGINHEALRFTIDGSTALVAGGTGDNIAHFAKVGHINDSLEFTGLSNDTGLAVYGNLFIARGALSDDSVTDKDIKDKELKAEDMSLIDKEDRDNEVPGADGLVQFTRHFPPANHGARTYPSPHVEIQGSVLGLNTDFLDGYDSDDFIEQAHKSIKICTKSGGQTAINNCINELIGVAGGVTSNYGSKVYTDADNHYWKCSYTVDTYPGQATDALVVCHRLLANEIFLGDNDNPAIIYGTYNLLNPGDIVIDPNPDPAESDIALNTIGSDNIYDGSIRLEDLAPNSVSTTELIDDSIISDDIKDGEISMDDLANNSVWSLEIAPNAVTTSHIVNESIRGGKDGAEIPNEIARETITGWNIKDGTIEARHISNNSVFSEHIIDDDITRDHIEDLTIQGDWANAQLWDGGGDIAEGAITGAHIKNGSIVAADLRSNVRITSSHIIDGSITSADINSTDDNKKVRWADVNQSDFAAYLYYEKRAVWGLIDSAKIGAGEVQIQDMAPNSVDRNKIVNSSVSVNDLAPDSVDSSKIAPQTIRGEFINDGLDGVNDGNGGDIAGNTITGGNIKDLSIYGSDIAAETITGWNIQDGSIGILDLANNSVGTDQIADNSIQTQDIASGVILAANINMTDLINNYDPSSIPNWVTGALITNNEVSTDDIFDGTIKGDYADSIPDNGGGDIAPNTITGWNIADLSLTADDLGPNSVDSFKIVDGTVSANDLATNSVGSDELTGIQKSDFSDALIASIAWQKDVDVSPADGIIDKVETADQTTYIIINSLNKKCKATLTEITYADGLDTSGEGAAHADTQTTSVPPEDPLDTFDDVYSTYDVTFGTAKLLTYDPSSCIPI